MWNRKIRWNTKVNRSLKKDLYKLLFFYTKYVKIAILFVLLNWTTYFLHHVSYMKFAEKVLKLFLWNCIGEQYFKAGVQIFHFVVKIFLHLDFYFNKGLNSAVKNQPNEISRFFQYWQCVGYESKIKLNLKKKWSNQKYRLRPLSNFSWGNFIKTKV